MSLFQFVPSYVNITAVEAATAEFNPAVSKVTALVVALTITVCPGGNVPVGFRLIAPEGV